MTVCVPRRPAPVRMTEFPWRNGKPVSAGAATREFGREGTRGDARGRDDGRAARSQLAYDPRHPTFAHVASTAGEIQHPAADAADPARAVEPILPELPEGKVRRLTRFMKRLGPAGPLAVVATVMPPVGAVCLLGIVALYAPSLREYGWAPVAC